MNLLTPINFPDWRLSPEYSAVRSSELQVL